MRMIRVCFLILTVGGMIGFSGCGGGGNANDVLVSIRIAPVSPTGASGTATAKVQFTATGSFAPLVPLPCGPAVQCVSIPGSPDYTQVLTNATWTTSDTLNTTIDSGGSATCLSATPGPVNITASAPGYDSAGAYTTIRGNAKLTCN